VCMYVCMCVCVCVSILTQTSFKNRKYGAKGDFKGGRLLKLCNVCACVKRGREIEEKERCEDVYIYIYVCNVCACVCVCVMCVRACVCV